MPSINCEINLDLNWSKNCVILVAAVVSQGATFTKTDTKFYALLVTLSTENNVKLLEQLKSGFKIKIKRNKYQSNLLTERQNQYLNYSTVPSFQTVNRLFVLSFEVDAERASYKRCYPPTVEIKDYVMNNGQNLFHQLVRNKLVTYDSIQKIAIGQEDDCTTGLLLDYNYFKQALDADSKAIQQIQTMQINFAGNQE